MAAFSYGERVSRSLDGFDFCPSIQSQQRTNPPTEFQKRQQREILGLVRAPRHSILCSRRQAGSHSPFRSPVGCPWTPAGCCCCRSECCSSAGTCRACRWAMEFLYPAATHTPKSCSIILEPIAIENVFCNDG